MDTTGSELSPAAPDDLCVGPRLSIPAIELRWRFSRSSGPGGQHVNTTDSRAALSWNIAASAALSDRQRERLLDRLGDSLVDGVVTVVASEHRSQWRNRELARQRLVELVAAALAPPPPARRPTRPSAAARQRRVETKKRRSETKRLRQRPSD